MEWISVNDRMPENGQKVWYFFHHDHFGFTIFDRGSFEYYEDDDVSRWPDTGKPVEGAPYPKADGTEGICNGEEPSDAMKFPRLVFGNDRGWLTNDVTHWMPDIGQDKPPRPV